MNQLIPKIRIGTLPNDSKVFCVYMVTTDNIGEPCSLVIGSALTRDAAIESAIRFTAALALAVTKTR